MARRMGNVLSIHEWRESGSETRFACASNLHFSFVIFHLSLARRHFRWLGQEARCQTLKVKNTFFFQFQVRTLNELVAWAGRSSPSLRLRPSSRDKRYVWLVPRPTPRCRRRVAVISACWRFSPDSFLNIDQGTRNSE